MRAWPGLSEHDHGAGGEDLRAARAAAADTVDDGLEVVQVADADAGEGVWIAGEGERFDHFGQVRGSGVDLVNLGTRGEPQLDESLNLLAREPVVDHEGVTTDEPDLLQPVDAALGGGRGQPHETAHLARGPARVGEEDVEDAAVG